MAQIEVATLEETLARMIVQQPSRVFSNLTSTVMVDQQNQELERMREIVWHPPCAKPLKICHVCASLNMRALQEVSKSSRWSRMFLGRVCVANIDGGYKDISSLLECELALFFTVAGMRKLKEKVVEGVGYSSGIRWSQMKFRVQNLYLHRDAGYSPTTSGSLAWGNYVGDEDFPTISDSQETPKQPLSTYSSIRDGCIDIAATIGTPAAKIIPRRTVYHCLDPRGLLQMRDWLAHCCQSHSACRSQLGLDISRQDPELPTRVIDVGLSDNDLKLFVSNCRRGRYTALSHRWSHEPFTLRSDNLKKLRNHIPANEFPPTFRDAIFVTRALGVRFLWIDSLCIIQDDKQDWEREAGTMCKVYQNAHCTIAATQSSGGKSFLNTDVTLQSPGFAFDCDQQKPELGEFSLVRVVQPDPSKYIASEELNQRGWVLQERLLSQRIIHFSKDQMYWECRTLATAQDGTIFANPNLRDFLFPLPALTKALGHGSAAKISDQGFDRIWLGIVEHFSACRLTEETDRLPSIYGLATWLATFTDTKYVGGHWLKESNMKLPATFSWTAVTSGSKLSRSQGFPSWSWTSFRGEITFEDPPPLIEVELRGYDTTETNGFSSLTNLSLRAKIKEFLVEDDGSRVCSIVDPDSRSLAGNITFDCPGKRPETVYCMYLFTDFASYDRIYALQLVENAPESNMYQRVGTGSLTRKSSGIYRSIVPTDLVLI